MRRLIRARRGIVDGPPEDKGVSRRDFFRNTALVGTGVWVAGAKGVSAGEPDVFTPLDTAAIERHAGLPMKLPDLRPARWLWYPSERSPDAPERMRRSSTVCWAQQT